MNLNFIKSWNNLAVVISIVEASIIELVSGALAVITSNASLGSDSLNPAPNFISSFEPSINELLFTLVCGEPFQ